jgi:SAM-dependent methyltransferase
MVDNKDLFRTTEFDQWRLASGVSAEEAILFDQFLEKDLSVLEAGTGGGRILLALSSMGFGSLSGFDYTADLIEQARRKQHAERIDFQVMDAEHLSYPSESFDRVLYLGQILCVFDTEAARQHAAKEAYRVLKPGGVALISLLLMEFRSSQFLYRVFLSYLKILRTLSRERRTVQSQPWLLQGGKPNLAALLDRPPYIHWFTVPEALALMRGAGFTVDQIATSTQLRAGILSPPDADLPPFYPNDMFYIVCRK